MLMIYLLNTSEKIAMTVYQKALEKSVTFILYPSIEPSFKSLMNLLNLEASCHWVHTNGLLKKERTIISDEFSQ